MSPDAGGRDLFVVDNSVSGWTGLRYLEEWTAIARQFDVATGFFEIGALLALDGKWQELEKVRILMGSDTTERTRHLLHRAAQERAVGELDRSIESTKDHNPFLHGVPAILEALQSGQIECRLYDRAKFHAKAYLTHGKMDIIGSQALVGSSNFTKPGLTQNIELNVQIQSAREVAQLRDWFEEHWKRARPATDAVIETVRRHVRAFTPFEIYAKALREYFRGHELTASEWDEKESEMFPRLDRYQKEAYWALLKIARRHGGAFLCDGVGLGKTFVGLMLIERLILHERKRVVLFAPKAAREAVWEPHLERLLKQVGGGSDFSNLVVFNHTDLSRKGKFPDRFARIAHQADAVVIDEAHHFRNRGRRGSRTVPPSRYYRLYELLDPEVRRKTVFFLTATPINNRLRDFQHMAELFTRCDDRYFGRTLGVNDLSGHFAAMERGLTERIGGGDLSLADRPSETMEVLGAGEIFRGLVVQRSRAYAKESQRRESGRSAVFPEREPPRVAAYSVEKTYGGLLRKVEDAFERKDPLFTLPMYYPLYWYCGPDKKIDPLEQGRQKQVVGLIRTNFLKRFESSVTAFELSCVRLLGKLLAFVDVHSDGEEEKEAARKWREEHAGTIAEATRKRGEYWSEDEEREGDEDLVLPEMREEVARLKRSEYRVPEMLEETYGDLDRVAGFLEDIQALDSSGDDKLQTLLHLLRSDDLASRKVLIFTEFADTARYVASRLVAEGVEGLDQLDGSSGKDRAEVIRRFSPYYNESSVDDLRRAGLGETRILVTTDVLSEGLNLQDATRMMNYDLHWNPVRLMQRIGRVDRRLDPQIERRLIEDRPEEAGERGIVRFWNFLPPRELNEILSLYRRVTEKTLLISATLGIEGRKLLTPDDDFEALKEFNEAYEGTRSAIEDMHLEFQTWLREEPDLEERLRALPDGAFSGRRRVSGRARGVFFCYGLPALDQAKNEFTEEAGITRWYLYDLDRNAVLEEAGEIVASIRSTRETPRHCETPEETLLGVRRKVLAHITDTYLKRVNAPMGVEPKLRCWMELN